VELLEFFLSQLRNSVRIAAGFKAVAVVVEQRLQCFVFQICVRRRIYALHFVINNAVVAQLAVEAVQIIMPALLTQGVFVLVEGRIEHSVQIYVHQVMEILIVAAGNGIHGLIREGHSVQKGVQRTLNEVYEGLL